MHGFYAPACCAVVNIVMWVFIIRQDSLIYLIDKDKFDDALIQFRRVYKAQSEDELMIHWETIKADRTEFKMSKSA